MNTKLLIGLFIVLCFVSEVSLAQEVTSVRPGEATVILPTGYVFTIGDEVTFLAADLSVAAKGSIKNISPNKTRAIVQVKTGKVEKGMVVETSATRAQPTATPVNLNPTKYSDLSEADRKALQIGEISDTSYIIGGVLGTYPLGLGIGHAIQGRYSDTGYIFTAGELASLAVLVAGIGDCDDDWFDDDENDHDCNGGLILLGAAGYVGFRIWEIIDVWAVPPGHNRRVREIKARTGMASRRWDGFIVPVQEGALAGISYRF